MGHGQEDYLYFHLQYQHVTEGFDKYHKVQHLLHDDEHGLLQHLHPLQLHLDDGQGPVLLLDAEQDHIPYPKFFNSFFKKIF